MVAGDHQAFAREVLEVAEHLAKQGRALGAAVARDNQDIPALPIDHAGEIAHSFVRVGIVMKIGDGDQPHSPTSPAAVARATLSQSAGGAS